MDRQNVLSRPAHCLGALAAVAVAAPAAGGCNRLGGEEDAPGPGERVIVRAFTDAAAVREIAADPPYVAAATDAGLDLWHVDDREREPLEAPGGLSGEVRKLDFGPEGEALWAATEASVGRYLFAQDAWQELPRVSDAVLADPDLEMVAAQGDAVWLGGAFGLARAGMDGSWSEIDVDGEVTGLYRDGEGTLWIGGEDAALALDTDEATGRLAGESECAVGGARIVTASLGGGVLVVGERDGEQRLAVFEEGECALLRASPDEAWMDAAVVDGVLAVLTESGLYSSAPTAGGARQLDRDGMRLLPISEDAGDLAEDYRLRAMNVEMPSTASSLALAGDAIWVGTDDRGTGAVDLDGSDAAEWLKRERIARGESGLTVHCASRRDCVLATGAARLWHFDGDRVRPGPSLQEPALAVVGGAGETYALRRGRDQGTIDVLSRARGEWRMEEDLRVEVPGREPEISFARRSPTGMLWLGLHYRDDRGALQPYGVALLNLRLGGVAYHRATLDEDEDRGVLPIPVNVSDASFAGGETWLATSEGAAAIDEEGGLNLYTEADGLRSEILRGIAVNPGGVVFVATRVGVGVYDGIDWRFPAALRDSVRALEFADDGRLWMATDQGLAAYDGDRVRRLDRHRGLFEDELRDLAVDGYDRVWVRGEEALMVVVP